MASSIFHAETLWSMLESACAAKDHPWRTPGLSTMGAQGPQSRHLVLRAVDPVRGVLRFYTDSRSAKISEIEFDQRVSVLFWNPQGNEQLRLWGTAGLVLDPGQLSAHWALVPAHARKEYSRLQAGKGQEEDAKAHFRVLEVQAVGMDFLKLSRAGHLRQVFRRGGDGVWEAHPLP